MNPGKAVLFALALSQGPGLAPATLRSAQFQFMRRVTAAVAGESCAVLDALVFSHAATSLKDLLLSSSIGEIPYTIILSETADSNSDAATLIQMRSQSHGVAFDLEMPSRPYTDVDLDLHQLDFIVTATVSGSNELHAPTRTPLGTFTIFDLTSKHLSRNTVLPLQESTFHYLHVEVQGKRLLPTSVYGAQVPPSRQAQTIYTTVATSTSLIQQGTSSIASFELPAHVPVERVAIEISPRYKVNFSRKVHVTGQAASAGDPVETIDGAIARVHLGKIENQQMAFPAPMGVNLQQNGEVQVAIENGKEAPLPISSVRLEMRRRSICFNAPAAPINLFYGSRGLLAPSFAPTAQPVPRSLPYTATLGPEVRNPTFHQRADTRTLYEHRPDLSWFLLLAGLGIAGMMMLYTLRRR